MASVLRGLLSNSTEWAYCIPFALQWVSPLPLLIGVLFALESPWWLVRHDRFDDVMNSVRRLQNKSSSEESVAKTVSVMRLTNEQEKAITEGTTFWDCFRGVDRRRTEITCITWACQNMCGSAFMGYSTYFYEAAGLADSNAFDFTMIQYALGLVGTLVAWILMAHFGRRTLYIAGLSILLVILVVIGGLGFTSSKSASWAVGSLLLVPTLAYDCTVGPVCYAIVAEVSSTRLRQKTVVLARATYNLCSILNNSLLPLQLNSLAWNWGAKDGLFWAGITLLCIIWCIFRLPESKGRTYAELNVLFEHRVAAWKFQGTKVDAFRGESIAVRRLSTTGSSNSDHTLQAGERV